MTELAQEFKVKFPKIKILAAEPLAKYTNTKTGGPAECLAFPKNVAEIKSLLVFAKENQVAVTVIGNASNLIVKEGGILGLVIILTDMNEIKVEGNFILAQAGASLIKTTQVAYQAGLTGLEFAAGIPGSIGGAIFMNAGAYDGEIKDVVKSVEVITRPQTKSCLQNNIVFFLEAAVPISKVEFIILVSF